MLKNSIAVGTAMLLLLVAAHPVWAAAVKNIAGAEVQQLLTSAQPPFLLDVRTPGEFLQVRISGARLIPIEQVIARQSEIPRNQPVLVYCAVGSRSAQVADYLARQGAAPVYNMTGGIMGWQLRGYPVLKGAP